MTRHLNSLGEMAAVLIEREAAMGAALEVGLAGVLRRIESVAKSEFGVYQPEVGPFPEWAELADSTKDDRIHQGYAENEPLLREGDLRDSIEHEQDLLEGIVGSTDEKMVFHEFGTVKMPARPVLGPAAYRSRPVIERLVGAAVLSGFVGAFVDPEDAMGYEVHKDLGYGMATKD